MFNMSCGLLCRTHYTSALQWSCLAMSSLLKKVATEYCFILAGFQTVNMHALHCMNANEMMSFGSSSGKLLRKTYFDMTFEGSWS